MIQKYYQDMLINQWGNILFVYLFNIILFICNFRIYDAKTGDVIKKIIEHNTFVECVEVSLNNKYIASGSGDKSCNLYEYDNLGIKVK